MHLTKIVCLGLSHNTAPVALRERISCALPEEHGLLDLVQDGSGHFDALAEIALVSTCNRIELYAVVDAPATNARQLLVDYLASIHPVAPDSFDDYLYFYRGRKVIKHLARVAAGLDSLVLGEPQILGQVNDAYMKAVEAHTIGPVLSALFRSAIRTGKRARTETAISSNPASVSSVAITMAQQYAGNLEGQEVLIVGLGEMGQLALNALRKRKIDNIALANRSRERAEKLAARWNGRTYGLNQLPQALAAADTVICATAAPHTVIDAATVQTAMAQRNGRPLVIIDIAVPRDVEPDVSNVPGVHLFDIDELQENLDEALAARQQEIPRVEAIIAEEIKSLEAEIRALTIKPVIVDLRQKAEAIRQRELERTLRFLGDDVDAETVKHVQHLSRSLVNKLLHEPTNRLREKATNGQATDYEATVRDLFDLNPPTKD
ncbi:MAG: glutamyl-tRNA reductase [Candidatus Promineifilaceae bacterium]|nr:glutamyl-tRNA reductase [Candidatus Promineifilaceae bacterium]